jgi:hypothetical protein
MQGSAAYSILGILLLTGAGVGDPRRSSEGAGTGCEIYIDLIEFGPRVDPAAPAIHAVLRPPSHAKVALYQPSRLQVVQICEGSPDPEELAALVGSLLTRETGHPEGDGGGLVEADAVWLGVGEECPDARPRPPPGSSIEIDPHLASRLPAAPMASHYLRVEVVEPHRVGHVRRQEVLRIVSADALTSEAREAIEKGRASRRSFVPFEPEAWADLSRTCRGRKCFVEQPGRMLEVALYEARQNHKGGSCATPP